MTPTREIRIETSTVCNYRCAMCTHPTHTRPRQIMGDELFGRIVQQARQELPQLQLCTVSGFGEFAADPHWKRKLSVAREHFEQVHVVTNLSLIADDDLEHLAQLATEVRVSLYASTEPTFQAIHRPAAALSLEAIERRLRRLASLRGEAMVLGLTCCQLAENQKELPSWIERWQGVVDWLEVWQPHNWVDGKGYRALDGARLASCGRPATGPLQVQVDGTVNVCCFDFDGKMVVGDLEQQSWREILTGPELSRIRALHHQGQADQLELCSVCDQREPLDRRAARLIYCSRPGAERRVELTSSGLERLPLT